MVLGQTLAIFGLVALSIVACQNTLSDEDTERDLPSTSREFSEAALTKTNTGTYLTSCLREKFSDLKRLHGTSAGTKLAQSCLASEENFSQMARGRFLHRSADGNYAIAMILNRFVRQNSYRKTCAYFFAGDCNSWSYFQYANFHTFYFGAIDYSPNQDRCENSCFGIGYYGHCRNRYGCWDQWFF